MKLLFDASALLNIVRELGPEAIKHLRGSYILTLTPYEVGNALLKESLLLRRITVEEALTLLSIAKDLGRVVRAVEPSDTGLVLRLAHELRATFHDSSYVATASELEAILVTDDEDLRRKVRERGEIITKILGRVVTTLSSRDIINT